MFKNIGRIGIEMYLLFQHHTTLELLRNVSDDTDLFTITGTGWHFLKYLGPAVVVVGPDCRSERNPHQVMAGPTYQGLFPKVAMLPPSVQHCIWMIAVPIVYPRLEAAEQLAHTVATGKKAVTGAYNVLGKVTSSVAGVVGAKGVVGSGFDSVKKAVGKSGLMGGILSPFGDIDMLDELRDQWTHESKDLERTYLIRTLQGISHQKSIRMTFLSGGKSSTLPISHLPFPLISPHQLTLLFHFKRRILLRRRPSPRPLPPLRPQNNVPNNRLLDRQRASANLHAQTPALQQIALHPRQRPPLHALPTHGHERRHDGDLPDRAGRPAEGVETLDGQAELRRDRELRSRGRAGDVWADGYGAWGWEVESRGGFHGAGRGRVWGWGK